MFDSSKEIWPMSQVPLENVGDSHKVPGKNVGAREQGAGAGQAFRFSGTSARALVGACEWLFQLAGIPNCHSFATVSRSLVALAEVRGALRWRGRMLVRVRNSRKRMVA